MMNRRSLAAIRGFNKKQLSTITTPSTRLGKLGERFHPSSALGIYHYPTLQPWSPFDPIAKEILGSRFSDELTEGLSDQIFSSHTAIRFDCKENETSFELNADLPGILRRNEFVILYFTNDLNILLKGLKKEDVHVNLKNGVLSISAEKKGMTKEEGDSFHREERFQGQIMRSISLPEGVNENKIDAKFMDGVLHISIPKLPEDQLSTSKTIEIK
jgi:HSP20 family molecular chaperone IbpA